MHCTVEIWRSDGTEPEAIVVCRCTALCSLKTLHQGQEGGALALPEAFTPKTFQLPNHLCALEEGRQFCEKKIVRLVVNQNFNHCLQVQSMQDIRVDEDAHAKVWQAMQDKEADKDAKSTVKGTNWARIECFSIIPSTSFSHTLPKPSAHGGQFVLSAYSLPSSSLLYSPTFPKFDILKEDLSNDCFFASLFQQQTRQVRS